jgi:hypothetical protein
MSTPAAIPSLSGLSAQEQVIAEGKKTLHGSITDRILRMRDAVRSHGDPRVQLNRAMLFAESFKNGGQPLVLPSGKCSIATGRTRTT